MNPYYTPRMNRTYRYRLGWFLGGSIFLGCVLLFGLFSWIHHLNTPPGAFPVATDIDVSEGMTLHEITELFESKELVRSSFMLYAALLHMSDAPVVQAGSYRFPEALTTRQIAEALSSGQYQSPRARVTFPEGFVAEELRSYYPTLYTPPSEDLPLKDYEGYLFPDTYHITKNTPEHALVSLMRSTFDLKIAPYTEAIAGSGFTLNEVITLASIVEREAKDAESKREVSGILQNRLKKGMPLQVDATLDYLLHKTSAELTVEDLETDSPFNTYVYAGLPPAPISNPGLESIEAVLYPAETEYLYYLTAPDGTFHYARTFEEHKENKRKYLPQE
jgi:UPF0755 protein